MESVLSMIVSKLLEIAVGALLTIALVWLRRLLGIRPARRIWRSVIQENKSIPIVIPSIVSAKFDIDHIRQQAELPENVNLVGLHDGLAIATLRAELLRIFPDVEFPVVVDKDFSGLDGSFITIGGPSVNRVARALLVDQQLAPGLSIAYPQHSAQDALGERGPRQFQPKYDATGRSLAEDWGFCIVADNPFSRNRRVCCMFGVWTFGTYAIVRAMTRPKPFGVYSSVGRYLSALRRHFSSSRSWLVVVRVNVSGLRSGDPVLIYSRELAGKVAQADANADKAGPDAPSG